MVLYFPDEGRLNAYIRFQESTIEKRWTLLATRGWRNIIQTHSHSGGGEEAGGGDEGSKQWQRVGSPRRLTLLLLLDHSHPTRPLVQFNLFAAPWTAARQASLSITNSQSLLKLMSTESVMPSNHLILCRPLLLQSFPASGSFPMSQFFISGGQSIGVSASTSVQSMNIQDWFPWGFTDLISLQSKGLSRVFSDYSSKASILQCSALFLVQLSHPYMTTGKTVALTRQTFVGKVMSLLFNTLSRLVIIFLLRNKCLSILWLQSPSAVIKSHCFHCSHIYLPWSDGTRCCHDLRFLNVEL